MMSYVPFYKDSSQREEEQSKKEGLHTQSMGNEE